MGVPPVGSSKVHSACTAVAKLIRGVMSAKKRIESPTEKRDAWPSWPDMSVSTANIEFELVTTGWCGVMSVPLLTSSKLNLDKLVASCIPYQAARWFCGTTQLRGHRRWVQAWGAPWPLARLGPVRVQHVKYVLIKKRSNISGSTNLNFIHDIVIALRTFVSVLAAIMAKKNSVAVCYYVTTICLKLILTNIYFPLNVSKSPCISDSLERC